MSVQEIICSGQSDSSSSFSLRPGRVHVTASRAEQRQADGRIRVVPTIKFAWTQQFYHGHLVASHHSLPLVAYTLKAVRSSHDEGVVRVFNSKTAAKALIKGYASRVVDIAFAHNDDAPTLASVDGHGTVHVDLIRETQQGSETLFTCRLLTIIPSANPQYSEYHRLAWCPYIADDEGEDDEDGANGSCHRDAKAKLLAATHDNELNLLDVSRLVSVYGAQNGSGDSSGIVPINAGDLSEDFVKFEVHSQPIMDLAISPEGGLVATSGLDGAVVFYQVEWDDGTLQATQMPDPWKPHEGRPVYRVLFLDDVRGIKKDVKFCCHAITCGESNREVKLWRLDSFSCVQTLHFLAPSGERKPELKVACDASGRYVVLTDITRSVFYIAEFNASSGSDDGASAAGPALVCLTEFVIADPCIDFAVASLKAAKPGLASTGMIGEQAQTLHLQTVGPRALQNHFITFAPWTSRDSASGATPASPLGAISASGSTVATPRSLGGNSTDIDLLLASGGSCGAGGSAVDSSTVTIVTGLASPMGSSIAMAASRDQTSLAVAASAASADAEAEPADDDAEVSRLMSRGGNINDDSAAADAIDVPPPPTNGDDDDDGHAIEPDEDEEDDDDDGDEQEAAGSEEVPDTAPPRDDLLILPDSPTLDHDDHDERLNEDRGEEGEEDDETEEDGCVEEDDERAAAVASLAAVDAGASDHPVGGSSSTSNSADAVSAAIASAVANTTAAAVSTAVGTAVGDLRQLSETVRVQSHQMGELQRQLAAQTAQLAQLADQHCQAERQLRADQQETLAGVRQAALTALDRLQQEVRDEVRRELAATNAAVQENITKFIRSRATVDTIGKTTAQCVQGPLVNAYKEMCGSLLFPRMEQMSQQLFVQLNSAFSAGLHELLAKVREETEAIAREQTLVKNKEISSLKAACTDVKTDLRSTADSIRREVDASLARLADQQQQQQRQFLEQHQRLMHEQQQLFQQQMQQQMQQLFQQQQQHQQQQQQQQQEQQQQQQRVALRSTLVTPVPQKQPEKRLEDYREAVNAALTVRDYNRAFKEALSSTRLELVLDLCSRVKPSDLFRSPNLEQQVILSLIQQLGRNLLERTKLKCDFLQESFDYLRPDESVVREHGKRVLQHLVKRIDELNSDSSDEFAYRTVRRIRTLAFGFISEHWA